MLEFSNRVEVITPKGDGVIWFVSQLGHETSLLFCVIQNSGTIYEWQPKDIKVKDNITFNRINDERKES